MLLIGLLGPPGSGLRLPGMAPRVRAAHGPSAAPACPRQVLAMEALGMEAPRHGGPRLS